MHFYFIISYLLENIALSDLWVSTWIYQHGNTPDFGLKISISSLSSSSGKTWSCGWHWWLNEQQSDRTVFFHLKEEDALLWRSVSQIWAFEVRISDFMKSDSKNLPSHPHVCFPSALIGRHTWGSGFRPGAGRGQSFLGFPVKFQWGQEHAKTGCSF